MVCLLDRDLPSHDRAVVRGILPSQKTQFCLTSSLGCYSVIVLIVALGLFSQKSFHTVIVLLVVCKVGFGKNRAALNC